MSRAGGIPGLQAAEDVNEFISLDGVIEDPGGAEKDRYEHGGWTFQFDRGEAGDQYKFQELMAADAQLLGRVTYEGFAKAWPTMEGTGEFGEKMNAMPKYVVSSTLEQPEWHNTTVLKGDLAAEIGKLKQQYAGDILLAGSARLAQSLLAADLVDELHLMVFPVVLGHGKRLFADGADLRAWALTTVRQSGQTAILEYARKR